MQHFEVQKASHPTKSTRASAFQRDVEEEYIVVWYVDVREDTRTLDVVGSGEDNMANEKFLYLRYIQICQRDLDSF